MDNEKFDTWAVIELFGHQRIAGHVTEQTIGGASFIRVDVPETADAPAFTRYLGSASIYAMNPCTEEIARAAAASAYQCRPALFDFRPSQLVAALPAGEGVSGDPEF